MVRLDPRTIRKVVVKVELHNDDPDNEPYVGGAAVEFDGSMTASKTLLKETVKGMTNAIEDHIEEMLE